MIINSLTLENFKSHSKTKLEFNENISLILGSNGAGKSSILEAISYSLFKDFTGKIDKLIRKSADDDIVNKMLVTIEFIHNGTTYQLKRGKNKSKNIAELRFKENDKFVIKSQGDRNVTHDIESILGMDSKSFLNAVYIRQGDITDLIEKTASERKELIAKLLNIDSFETAWEEIKKLIEIYEEKLKSNKLQLEKKDEIEEVIKQIEEKIAENTKELDENIPLKEELKTNVAKLENEVNELLVNKTKYESFNENLSLHKNILAKHIENKESNENKLKKIEADEKEIEKLEKEVKPLEHLEELKDTKNDYDKNNETLKQLNKNINEVKQNIEIRENNKESHEKFLSLTEEIERLRKKRKELDEEYIKFNSIKGQIHEKETNREKLRKEIQKASEDATALFKEYFDSPESIEKKVKEEKEKTEQFIEDLTKKINENNNTIGIKENDLKNTRKSLTDLEHTEDICPICQSEISHEKHEELSAKYKDNIVNYELEIENLNDSNKNQENVLSEKKEYLNKINYISIDVLKEKNKEFITLNSEIKSLKSKIPPEFIDDTILKEMDKEIAEKEELSKNLKEKSDAYIFAVKRLSEIDDIDTLTTEINELNKVNQNLKTKCKEIMIRYAVKDNLGLQIQHLKTQNEKLNLLKGSVSNKEDIVNNIKSLDEEINNCNENIKNNEIKIKNLNYDKELYENKNSTYIQEKKKLEEINDSITRLDTEIKKDNENIDSKNKELKNLEKIAKEQNNIKDYIIVLNDLRDIYSKDGVQKDLRENVRPLIEKETLDIFNEFDFDYTGISLDADYNMTIYNKNEELDIDMISGGEKIVIALALRLGIAAVLSKNKTDLLILDEPTIHLDEDRRSRLIDIIRQITFVPQMIVVTHDDEMESISNNIIKIKKLNGISSIDNS